MTYQPYAWPRPQGPDAEAAARAHRDAGAHARAQTRTNVMVALLFVGVIAALVGINVFTYRYMSGENNWANRDVLVQQRLNDMYVEDFQIERGYTSNGRFSSQAETVVVDGMLRSDCKVDNDDNPTLDCDYAITLTPETGAR